MLSLIPLVLSNWRVFLYGGTAIAIGLWAWHYHDTLIAQGAQQERATMEKANEQAKSDADKAQAEVDACYARGPRFSWDRVRGVCVGSAG
jgi:hypothetical protein